jgi:hypothetical protein
MVLKVPQQRCTVALPGNDPGWTTRVLKAYELSLKRPSARSSATSGHQSIYLPSSRVETATCRRDFAADLLQIELPLSLSTTYERIMPCEALLLAAARFRYIVRGVTVVNVYCGTTRYPTKRFLPDHRIFPIPIYPKFSAIRRRDRQDLFVFSDRLYPLLRQPGRCCAPQSALSEQARAGDGRGCEAAAAIT